MKTLVLAIVCVWLWCGFVVAGDRDDDGVKNKEDLCPATDLAQPVLVGSCNAGFADVVDPDDGCSLNQGIDLCICASTGSCAGLSLEDRVKRCIRVLANSFHDEGLITGGQRADIRKCLHPFQP